MWSALVTKLAKNENDCMDILRVSFLLSSVKISEMASGVSQEQQSHSQMP